MDANHPGEHFLRIFGNTFSHHAKKWAYGGLQAPGGMPSKVFQGIHGFLPKGDFCGFSWHVAILAKLVQLKMDFGRDFQVRDSLY